jgi:zinc protease
MRRLILAALLAFILGGISVAKNIFPYVYHKEILPNGLTVICIPMESPGLISYYSVVRTGSRDEVEPGKSGFAHFFEHMMFGGTKKYPASVYDSIMTSLGADANAYTTDDLTTYHLNFAKDDLEKVVEMESDRFQNLSYEKQEFQTEAGAVYGEFRKSVTNPYFVLSEKTQDLAYTIHTYKHTTMGFEADIKAMPEGFDFSRSFFDRFYRPDNVVLLIAGDIQVQRVMLLVKQYYGSWQKGYVPSKITQEPPQNGERSTEISYDGKTLPILNVAYKGDAFNPTNKEYVAAMLLGDLAFGENSDLYKKLVVREQRVEWISASIPMNRDLPLFEITTMIKKLDDVITVRDEIYHTLESYAHNLVERKKLDDLKRRSTYQFLMGLDTPARVAGGMARFAALTGSIEVVDQLYTSLDNITPLDIQRAAVKYFTPERRTVVVLKGAQQ